MRSLCENEVAAECLAVKSPHACIDDLTEEKLAGRAAAAAPSGPSWAPHPAAIAVPAVCAGALQYRAPFGAAVSTSLLSTDVLLLDGRVFCLGCCLPASPDGFVSLTCMFCF
jgi:hypothetical protein